MNTPRYYSDTVIWSIWGKSICSKHFDGLNNKSKGCNSTYNHQCGLCKHLLHSILGYRNQPISRSMTDKSKRDIFIVFIWPYRAYFHHGTVPQTQQKGQLLLLLLCFKLKLNIGKTIGKLQQKSKSLPIS